MKIPLWQPSITDQEKASVLNVFSEAYHTARIHQFEEKAASLIGVDKFHILACSTGHAALHIILSTLLKERSKVLSPNFNNIADFQATINSGHTLLLLDSEHPSTPFVSPSVLDQVLANGSYDAFIALDYASCFCPLEEYWNICNKYDVRLIYDAAHSFGSVDQDRMRMCDAAFFSFDPIKTFSAIDGGLIYFREKAHIELASEMRFIGIQQDQKLLMQNKRTWKYDVRIEGYRYHMSNVHAAFGLSQLNRSEEIRNSRSESMAYFRNLFDKSIDYIDFFKWDQDMIPFMNVALVSHQ